MTKYRNNLPQMNGRVCLTDSGLETTLVFQEEIELPCFAAFVLLKTRFGTDYLRDYIRTQAEIARKASLGFVLEAPTWRANAEWGRKLGYSAEDLDEVNQDAIALLLELRRELETVGSPMPVSGQIGPRGDGYDPGALMTPEEAEAYHAPQIASFANAGADQVTAMTINNVNEAIGIARAAKAAGMPLALAFTVETDGKLPTGQTLGAAIEAVDADTDNGPAYYMINCAHPTHFEGVLDGGWMDRVKGVRANASRQSHEELDNCTELDAGDPHELGRQYADLRERFPHMTVLGGCCGTDHRHIEQICGHCAPVKNAA